MQAASKGRARISASRTRQKGLARMGGNTNRKEGGNAERTGR
jgi:hypothetical protein